MANGNRSSTIATSQSAMDKSPKPTKAATVLSWLGFAESECQLHDPQ